MGPPLERKQARSSFFSREKPGPGSSLRRDQVWAPEWRNKLGRDSYPAEARWRGARSIPRTHRGRRDVQRLLPPVHIRPGMSGGVRLKVPGRPLKPPSAWTGSCRRRAPLFMALAPSWEGQSVASNVSFSILRRSESIEKWSKLLRPSWKRQKIIGLVFSAILRRSKTPRHLEWGGLGVAKAPSWEGRSELTWLSS